MGITSVNVGQIPRKDVKPVKVMSNVRLILRHLGKIKESKNITAKNSRAPFVGGKTPTNVYENMWHASYMMDGISDEINPSYVYRNTELILTDLRVIADKMGKSVSGVASAPVAGKTPTDVNREGFNSFRKLVELQNNLGMEPFNVHPFPGGRITPSDVYDTTYNLIAELVRVKIELGISNGRANVPVLDDKNPSDVLTKMQLISSYLDQII